MIKIGDLKFATDVEYFEYVIRKYFRKIPPIPTNLYLNSSDALEIENRAKVAELCHFPTIVNTLARDENEQVQQAAMKNEFKFDLNFIFDVNSCIDPRGHA